MKKPCKFCCEALEKGAKKCKICGEPFYFLGKVLKWVPLLSIVITLLSLGFACHEMIGKEKATIRAETAQSETRLAVSQLYVKERAADRAIGDLARKLPESSKEDIVKGLRLPPGTTIEQLEQRAEREPGNSDLQKKLFLYRALKRPD